MKKGERGALVKISDAWGVSVPIIEEIQKREKRDIMMLRYGIAERSATLAAMTQDQMALALQDPEKMKETKLVDFARSVQSLTEATVTAIDGHQTIAPIINFGVIKQEREKLKSYDEAVKQRLEEMKRAKVIDQQPA